MPSKNRPYSITCKNLTQPRNLSENATRRVHEDSAADNETAHSLLTVRHNNGTFRGSPGSLPHGDRFAAPGL